MPHGYYNSFVQVYFLIIYYSELSWQLVYQNLGCFFLIKPLMVHEDNIKG
jgi:hypothetical protein